MTFECGACRRTIDGEDSGASYFKSVREGNGKTFLVFCRSMGRCPICCQQVSIGETPEWIMRRAAEIQAGNSPEEGVERCPPGTASGAFINWR